MKKNCIINVAARHPYVDYQKRLLDNAAFYEVDILSWTDCFPPGSKTHHESLYGFKVHAFKYAFKQGYTNVLWLDSPCYITANPYPIFDKIEKDGCYLIGTETPLWKHCNNRSLHTFGLTRDQIKKSGEVLLSGSFIGWNVSEMNQMFEEWYRYEQLGYFLTAEEDSKQVKEFPGDMGHRHDETILSLLAGMFNYKITMAPDSDFQCEGAIIKAEKW